MGILIHRRSLLRGLFAMPAVVIASSLMPVRGLIMDVPPCQARLGPWLSITAYTKGVVRLKVEEWSIENLQLVLLADLEEVRL